MDIEDKNLQPFENFESLREHIQRMACTGQTGSVFEWSDFLGELNNVIEALQDRLTAAELDKSNLKTAIEDLEHDCDQYKQALEDAKGQEPFRFAWQHEDGKVASTIYPSEISARESWVSLGIGKVIPLYTSPNSDIGIPTSKAIKPQLVEISGESDEPVALAHITMEDDGPIIDIEVLNGEKLQPEMSPVKLYLASPNKADVPEWYDITRAMPEFGEYMVLFWNSEIDNYEMMDVSDALSPFFVGVNEEGNNILSQCDYYEHVGITHWMPLPLPP